jgi:predicted esterase
LPQLAGECPEFRDGTITFMGLTGITVVAGTRATAPSAPLVFYWHGTGSQASEFNSMAKPVRDAVVQEGGVLISFQGSSGGDALSGTNIFGRSDLDITDQLVACAVKNYNVDPRRVFVTGCSAGALFAAAMATVRSSYIAAVATNSGGITTPLAFEDSHTPALMTVHGRPGTDVVGADFAVASNTADKAFSARGAFVINCNHDGAHCGGSKQADDIWEFFKAHPWGTSPSPWQAALPATFDPVCKIF